MNSAPVQITLLSSIAGPDFPSAIRLQVDLGLRLLDLKDGLWGKNIEQIDEPTAIRMASLCNESGVAVDSFSTNIGRLPLTAETDERNYRLFWEPLLGNALAAAVHLRPRTVRLLLPILDKGPCLSAFERLQTEFPWMIDVYRDWVDRIEAKGIMPVLENEVRGCLFATAEDVIDFFTALQRGDVAKYTYDVQNLWQNGVYPSLEIYRKLAPWMGGLHLKGGRSSTPGGSLTYASSLEEASWPVLEIVRAAIGDTVCPVICLNPSHGKQPAGWDIWETSVRDLAFLRQHFPQIL